ncbi:MAG: DUF72 domain-containing protein [Candidatus Aminicenantes bacterium]|nr:DUF72 domain-containing protein [Candidatus Aminicenantes bacterium]
MADMYFGTAGWSYKDWEGLVYPLKKSSGFHPLPYLARYINIVEVNSTFYRPPVLRISLSWIKRVEGFPEFLFAVKLHQIFTHQRKDISQKDIDQFKTGIEPLRGHGRLASLLLQFPWSFSNNSENFTYLVRLFTWFKDYPLALEIRHSSWETSSFFECLSEHKVCYCNIDQPVFRDSVKPSAVSTNNDFAYVRLHGRNYKNWFKKDAGRDARYDYLYSRGELEEWVDKIKELGKKSKKVMVITNNHYRGQALANALQLKNMITGEKLDIPRLMLEHYPDLKTIVKNIRNGQLDLFEE